MSKLLLLINLLILHLLLPFQNFAQSASEYGFIEHSTKTKELGVVNFYLSDTLHSNQKPLLIYLDGSGDSPLAYYKKDSTGKLLKYSGIPLNIKTLKLKYHILVISKPNIPFAKELTDQINTTFDSQYNHYSSCDWRVKSTSLAIDFVFKNYRIDKNKVIILGMSEGGSVAPRVAVYNKKITHCIAVAGGGLNQYFDQIIKYRMLASKGEITHEEAQIKIDSLFGDFDKIYKNPEATDLFWFGHTYKRWSSYTKTPTIEYIKKLSIPTLIIQCTDDENVSVLSADYIRLEYLRLYKTNLTFKNYPGLNHAFKNLTTGQDLFLNAIDAAITWAETN